jgi:hypothetical protein
MGQRGPTPLPIELKRLKGTLNPSRERKRREREIERERERENFAFARTVVRYFLGEPDEKCDELILDALRRDVSQLASRLWKAHEADFRQEYWVRYPRKPEPAF